MFYRKLVICSLLALVAPTSVIEAKGRKQPPNIVFVLADDLGIGDVRCFGGDRCQIETPAFDRLASEGVRFTDAHALASVCVPTRVGIMTGRYPWRFQRPRPDGPWGFLNPRLPAQSVTLPRMLSRAGYATGYVGKWHLGTKMPTKDGKNQGPTNVDYTKKLELGPTDYGFDFSFILPGSLDMFPYVFVKNHSFLGPVTKQRGWSAFNRVGPTADDFEDYKVLNTFANEAEQFIGRQTSDRPFFLYLALTAPHTPVSPSKKFEGVSKLGLYGDFVMETDDCLRRVLDALDRKGLAENTLVIATSDHGPASYAGNIRKSTFGQMFELEKRGHFAAGIYRGYKFSIYEGGLRVPFVARWPKVVTPGSQCDKLIGLQDLWRTFADVAQVKAKANEAPDSVSFLAALRDPQKGETRQRMVMRSVRSFAIRKAEWKLALCPGSGCPGAYGNTPKQDDAWRQAKLRFGRAPKNQLEIEDPAFLQLFDLSKDPTESRNLAKSNPAKVKELLETLKRDIAQGRSTPGEKLPNDLNVKLFSVPAFVWR